jgi:cell division protein FtsB
MSTPVKRPLAPRNQGSSLQIVFGSILAISLLLAINFSGRIAAGRQIDTKRDALDQSISTLQAQATALQSELNFVNSDAFIGQWARKEGRMVKPNEVLIVPVPGPMTPEPSPTPFVSTVTDLQNQQPNNWKLWWQLFFDAPPPEQ